MHWGKSLKEKNFAVLGESSLTKTFVLQTLAVNHLFHWIAHILDISTLSGLQNDSFWSLIPGPESRKLKQRGSQHENYNNSHAKWGHRENWQEKCKKKNDF